MFDVVNDRGEQLAELAVGGGLTATSLMLRSHWDSLGARRGFAFI